MDSDVGFDDLPIRVPIWNSSVAKNLLIERNRYRCDLLPDFGGAGIDVKFNETSTSLNVMKQNSLRSANFYPKCCCLPIISRWDRWKQHLPRIEISEYFPNSSCLDLDENLLCVLYTDFSRKKVIVSEYVEKECETEMCVPSIFEISANSVECDCFNQENGVIREVVKTTDVDGSPVAIVKQDNCLTFLEVLKNELNNEINMNVLCTIDSSKVGDAESLFQFGSCSELLPGFVAIAGQAELNNRKEVGFLMEYDINEDKHSWQSTPEVGFKYPVGVHWTSHPRIIAYGETRRFGVVDVRIESDKCFSNIISREDIRTINSWEKFRLVSSNPAKDNQHLIATDCHLCIYDIRFPKGIVLQWSHTVNSEDSLNFLKSSGNLNCDISGDNGINSYIIAVANQSDVCLFNTKSSINDSVNQNSLHPPLHISKPSDCYYFSQTGDGDIYDHIINIELIGLKVLQSKCGFSVFQLTNKGDVFVQDFYHKDFVDDSDKSVLDYSWRYSTAPEQLRLKNEVVEYIVDTFKAEEENEQMNDETTLRVCECCEIVCKLRDQQFFGRCTSELNVISKGKPIKAKFLHIGNVVRKKVRNKTKQILTAPSTQSTPDDYIHQLTDAFMTQIVTEANEDNEQMEVPEMNEESQEETEPSLKDKLLEIWREEQLPSSDL